MKTDERSFSDYVAMLKRRWKLAAGIGGLVFLGFVVYAFAETPVYEATATIQIELALPNHPCCASGCPNG